MSKRVDETKAGKSIAAWVIISPENKFIGKIQAHYSDAGRVTVNVWNFGDGESYQEGYAGGYGYDKLTAALNHMVIDGHELTNHCDVSLEYPDGLDYFPREFVVPAGYHTANYRYELKGYASCYRHAGIEYLKALGYSVIQAI